MAINEVLEQAKTLSQSERAELAQRLIQMNENAPIRRRLSELRGLGKEIWQGIDARKYVDQMRDEWDNRP